MRLNGKVALISGSARGIGEATARLFAREGAAVIVADVLEAEGRAVAESIAKAGGNARFLKLDVRKENDWQQAVYEAESRFGKLNVLVNNAGVSGAQFGNELTEEAWRFIMDVNSSGVFLGVKAAVPTLKRAGGGSIINMSSQLGVVGSRFTHPAYNASKGAVRTLTKAIAIQYARDGIRCNSVHPGPIDTPMAAGIFTDPAVERQALAQIPLGRRGHAEEVAYTCLYLASDESSYVTGAELVVDGGWLAQ
ncbi:MAG: SDR family oxidoreductase [SAR202 cluster bacterium]|nr:SDR family oxidoreductase [SAR202 cluster bacterium]